MGYRHDVDGNDGNGNLFLVFVLMAVEGHGGCCSRKDALFVLLLSAEEEAC